MAKKLLVIGLDCVPPKLIFEEFRNDLPHLNKLLKKGIYAKLRSCYPPITVPAWAVMTTGKNPGKLGLYGIRHRKAYSYNDFWVSTSQRISEPSIWDIMAKYGKKSCLIGIPPSFPPCPVNGYLISGFLTPSSIEQYTYPPELKDEIERINGKYIFDVEDFRTHLKDELLAQIYEMSKIQFDVIKYLMVNKEWDFFMSVLMGPDRIHHSFWNFQDTSYSLFKPSKYENTIKNYYKYIDSQIGEFLKIIDSDTCILVVSDHGAKRMHGNFCINEWFIKEGYLKLKEQPNNVILLEDAKVDWENTIAWGWGGYYARIFLNVKGRESMGVIDPEDYEKMRDELIEKLKNVTDPDGRKMNSLVVRPETLYPECNGDYPDLLAFFDDLYWRSAGTIGHSSLYLQENDIGPDDIVHDWNGIFIAFDPKKDYGYQIDDLNIQDVAPTALHLMGLPIPEDMEGKIIRLD